MQLPTSADGEREISVLHQELVDQVKARGYITSPRVEAAFRAVPRHLFLPNVPPQEVYQDKVIRTKMVDNQYVSASSQPAIMAIMLEQLNLQPGQRVLEIGAGTGYNAALMAHIVGKTGQVVTIDIDEDIVEGAREHLAAAGYERVQVLCADGGLGYSNSAPYDRIILTVSSGDITSAWYEQLKQNGRFLLPLVVRGPQVSVAFEPVGDSSESFWESVSVRACGFVGLRGAFAESGYYVQLDPEFHRLYLKLGERRPVNAERVVELLKGPGRDILTQVRVAPQEIYWGLNLWLALHEPLYCEFIAVGEVAKSGIVPQLLSHTTNEFVTSSIGLLSEDSLSLLSFATRQPASTNASSELLQLMVRSFGPDDTLASRLESQIAQWDAAGRPNEQRLRIRAYTNEDAYIRDEQDILLARQWTRFVFRWQE